VLRGRRREALAEGSVRTVSQGSGEGYGTSCDIWQTAGWWTTTGCGVVSTSKAGQGPVEEVEEQG
jgi:hypothetical protein